MPAAIKNYDGKCNASHKKRTYGTAGQITILVRVKPWLIIVLILVPDRSQPIRAGISWRCEPFRVWYDS